METTSCASRIFACFVLKKEAGSHGRGRVMTGCGMCINNFKFIYNRPVAKVG